MLRLSLILLSIVSFLNVTISFLPLLANNYCSISLVVSVCRGEFIYVSFIDSLLKTYFPLLLVSGPVFTLSVIYLKRGGEPGWMYVSLVFLMVASCFFFTTSFSHHFSRVDVVESDISWLGVSVSVGFEKTVFASLVSAPPLPLLLLLNVLSAVLLLVSWLPSK